MQRGLVGCALSISVVVSVVSVASAQAPTVDEVQAAPRADEASGIEVAAPPPDHEVANSVLAVPRAIVTILFLGPRYAATGLDYYLESRSPNAFARDVKKRWRLGILGEWEPRTGATMAARVGYAVSSHFIVDAFGGLFGTRGQSGGVRVLVGRFPTLDLAPSLTLQAGRELERVFSGIGAHGSAIVFRESRRMATLDVPARIGPLAVGARATIDATTADRPEVDDAMDLVGAGERDRAATLELSAAYDRRRTTEAWLPAAEPSRGWFVRGTVSGTRGDAERTGGYQFGRATVEARTLVDLFHGDRVLSLGARIEAISANARDVPFTRLPGLGGLETLRALGRDELRDRHTTFADLEYAWPLGNASRGYLFVEAGEVHASWRAFDVDAIHVGYGGGVRVHEGATTYVKLQVAGADGDEVGVYALLGAL